MTTDPFDQPRGFLQRYGFALGVFGVIVVVAFVFGGQMLTHRHAPVTRRQQIAMVRLLPAPPPAPPPPPPPPPKMEEQKMIDQQPVDDDEPKPDDKPKAAVADLGTSIKGDGGSDAFGLHGGGRGFLSGGSGGRQGSRWGWYAGEVQTAIADALRQNPRTRDAHFRVEVRVWSDAIGRIVRAHLAGSTGDPSLDSAIRDQVLTGLQLREPPPSGMPMPIVMRLTARRSD